MTHPHPAVQQITAPEYQALREAGNAPRLIDVREPNEHAIASVAGADLLPMSRAQEWLPDLDKDQAVVFMCHGGFRSQQVAQYAVQACGLRNVSNMVGGIDAWSREVDPSVPRY